MSERSQRSLTVLVPESRLNPFDQDVLEADQTQLILSEVRACGSDSETSSDDDDLGEVGSDSSADDCGPGEQHSEAFPVDPSWTCGITQDIPNGLRAVSNPHACVTKPRGHGGPRMVAPPPPPPRESVLEPQGPRQLLDVTPASNDTVTVWVPGGLDISRPGCCSCRRRIHCAYWVAGPGVLLLVGMGITMWVWLRHGRDPNVMKDPGAASAVLVGPILTLVGILGIFVACVLHEIHSRRSYDHLREEANNEEFL